MKNAQNKHMVIKDGKFYTGTEFSSNKEDAMWYNIKSATMVAVRERAMVY
jgi:hypothetical protein